MAFVRNYNFQSVRQKCVCMRVCISMCSMRSMRSMHGELFSVVEGPCTKYAIALTHMSGHNCLPGLQTICSQEGNHMNKTRVFTGRWHCRWNLHNQNSPHAFPHASTTTPVSADFASTLRRSTGPRWMLRLTGGEDFHSLSVPTDLGETSP
jgi:hypothetical protein